MKWFFILLLVSFHAVAQKRDTVLKYFDAALNPTDKKNAVYAGAAIHQQDGWSAFALYPDTSYILKAYYKDKALTVKEGPYAVFYPGNRLASAGFFHDNRITGIWRNWYENGQLKDSGMLYYNVYKGLWKSWFQNGQLKEEINYKTDSVLPALPQLPTTVLLSNAGIREGPYKSWYQNGKPEATGNFANGSLDSIWNWYYENGKPSTIETYQNGKVTALTCFDSLGNNNGELCSIAKPALLRQYGDWRLYVQQNLMWPKEAWRKNISGTVKVSFRVTKEGRLDHLTIETPEPMFKKAVEGLFTSMTDWLPAVSHNRVIDTNEEIVIPFVKNE